MDFPFGPWEPDRGETSLGRCVIADSVVPLAEGYGPMPSLTVSNGASALPAAPRGVYSLKTAGGTFEVYAGTVSHIYVMDNSFAFSSIGSGYAVPAGDDWSMQKFGTKLLFSNTTDGLNAYDFEAGGAATSIAAAGNPRQIFICGNQVVGLDCVDNAGARDNRLIRTSGFSDQTNWTTNGADYQPLEDGGALVIGGPVSDTAAVIVQESATRLMTFGDAGNGALFALGLIAPGTGSVGAKSFATADGRAFWIATDGFYMYSLGGGLVPIGSERVNRWFQKMADQSNLSLAQASVDPIRKIVWWRFKKGTDTSTLFFDSMIGFAWQLDNGAGRWVTAQQQTSYLVSSATPGYDADNADSLGLADNVDTLMDSRFFAGTQPLLSALDGSFKFGVFAGGAMAATIQTFTANSPVTGLISRATLVDDAAGGTLSLGVKDDLSNTIVWKAGAARGRAGRVPLRGRGLNIAFTRTIPANENWTVAKGVDHVSAAQGGPT